MVNVWKDKKNKYLLLVFCVAFVPRVICNLSMEPVRVIMDEVCALNGAAYFAGLDWSNVVNKGSYYGIGFFGLFSFVFRITDNPYFIYYFVLIVLSLLQSVTAVICFKILMDIFNVNNMKWNFLVSIACSYMVVTRANDIMNEMPLILMTWVIVRIILLLADKQITKVKKKIYTIALAICLVYSLSLHTRAIMYWIALGGLLFVYLLLYRKSLISILDFLIVSIIFIPIEKMIIGRYQSYMWESGKHITNTTIDIMVSTKATMNENIEAIAKIVLGEINTIGVYTGGMAYIVICICIAILIRIFFRKKEIDVINEKMFLVVIFCGICVGATIVGMSVSSWQPNVVNGIIRNITKDYYPYKSITYVRYFGPYLGPLLMICFIYLKKYEEDVNKIIKWAIILMIPIQLYWIRNIIPYISKNSTTHGAFILFSFWNENKELDGYIYYWGIQVMVITFFIYRWIHTYYKQIGIITICFGMLFAQYLYGTYVWDVPWAKESSQKVNAGYEWISKLEKEIQLPKEIYVQDNIESSHHKTYMLYQFYLNKYTIIPDIPKENVEEVIFLVNTREYEEELCKKGYKIVQLDEDEYAYVKGARLLEGIK